MDKVCGLDVHKDSVFACILVPSMEMKKKLHKSAFSPFWVIDTYIFNL